MATFRLLRVWRVRMQQRQLSERAVGVTATALAVADAEIASLRAARVDGSERSHCCNR